MAHSTKWVCWDCRRCISKLDNYYGARPNGPPHCNKCSKPLSVVHYRFKPPKQKDTKAWDQAALDFKMVAYVRAIDELFPTFQTQAEHNKPNKVDRFRLKNKGKRKFVDSIRR